MKPIDKLLCAVNRVTAPHRHGNYIFTDRLDNLANVQIDVENELKQIEEDERIDFKNKFVIAFLASWCANHYEDFCARGLHDELANPPIEDAKDMAQSAWEKLKKDGFD
jgi:hypothetical protein